MYKKNQKHCTNSDHKNLKAGKSPNYFLKKSEGAYVEINRFVAISGFPTSRLADYNIFNQFQMTATTQFLPKHKSTTNAY